MRAFRRPLTSTEDTAYLSLYTLGKTNGDASNGFRLVVEAMLQSPFFLYHPDLGAQAAPRTAPVALTPYELASRLSYFLWNSMPDRPLFTRRRRTAGRDRCSPRRSTACSPTLARRHDRACSTCNGSASTRCDRDKDPALYPQFTARWSTP